MPGNHETTHLRATPVQTRSAKTLDVILAASAELLTEHGLPGFNTNAVARAAGINVATLYHYFPNKNAILRELFDRYEDERTAYARSRLDELAVTDDIEGWLSVTIGELMGLRQRQRGAVALRRACRAVPELTEAMGAATDSSVMDLGGALARRLPGLPAPRVTTAARAIVETSSALLDMAGDRPESASAVLDELRTMIAAYLRELAHV
jgi:AcrR family transcriptional regulator